MVPRSLRFSGFVARYSFRKARLSAALEGADVPIFKTTRAGARALSLLVEATM